jgi:hypothetical protein
MALCQPIAHVVFKNLAFPADAYFLLPAFLLAPPAAGAVQVPAEAPHFQFPGYTDDPPAFRAFLDFPARTVILRGVATFEGEEEEHFALDMSRYPPPSLLETLDGLRRDAKQLSKLGLGPAQQVADFGEFRGFHLIVSRGAF